MPDVILFDWDGTLADSYSYLNDAHADVLQTLGFPPFKKDEFKNYFGKPREYLYPHIYKDKAEDAKILFEAYVNENAHKLKPMSGAHELLQNLQGQDVLLGVVSNKKGVIVRREIEAFGWAGFFKTVVAAGEASQDKPSGAPIKLAIHQVEMLEPSYGSVWYVGDTEIDLMAAKDAECPCILVAPHALDHKKIQEYNPLTVSDDCHSLKEFLVAISR